MAGLGQPDIRIAENREHIVRRQGRRNFACEQLRGLIVPLGKIGEVKGLGRRIKTELIFIRPIDRVRHVPHIGQAVAQSVIMLAGDGKLLGKVHHVLHRPVIGGQIDVEFFKQGFVQENHTGILLGHQTVPHAVIDTGTLHILGDHLGIGIVVVNLGDVLGPAAGCGGGQIEGAVGIGQIPAAGQVEQSGRPGALIELDQFHIDPVVDLFKACH